MHDLSVVFSHVCQFGAIPMPNILASSAQPDGMVIEILSLFLTQVPPVQIVSIPPLIIGFQHLEIAKAKTRFGPPHILRGAVYPSQHHALLELFETYISGLVIVPILSRTTWSRLISRLIVDGTDIVDRIQPTEVSHKDHGNITEAMFRFL